MGGGGRGRGGGCGIACISGIVIGAALAAALAVSLGWYVCALSAGKFSYCSNAFGSLV